MNQSSKKSAPTELHQWEQGWDEHEQMQLQRLARLTLAEKLEWLEQAHRVVIRLKAAQSSRDDKCN